MSKGHHQKLLYNVTKICQKVPSKVETSFNLKAKSMSIKLKISDRVKRIARTPAFVTFKDHKDNFCSNPMICLRNPSKTELGKVSEQLVEKMDSDIIEKLQFNQWRNTDAVLKWFNDITDKSNCNFIQFDMKGFYSSMTENILHQTLKFAKHYTNIDKNDLCIINHCRKSLLFFDHKTLKNKLTDSYLDVRLNG